MKPISFWRLSGSRYYYNCVQGGFWEIVKCWCRNNVLGFTEFFECVCRLKPCCIFRLTHQTSFWHYLMMHTFKLVGFNNLLCTCLFWLFACWLWDLKILFPRLLSPSGAGKPITHKATWHSRSASPWAPWSGTGISEEWMESTNQHTHWQRLTNSNKGNFDWLVEWQPWQRWDHYRPGAVTQFRTVNLVLNLRLCTKKK